MFSMLHLVSVLALAALALAKPLAVTPRDSVSPPITSPTADSVWTVGETQTVTWDTSALNGVMITNPSAQIVLGTLTNGEENLMLDSPLASGFNITDGKVSLIVPSVPPGKDYIVCLFGDSGDISPAFQIVASTSASSSGAQHIATSSNTLPPHETTDPSTSSTSLPSGVVQTSSASSTVTSTSSVTGTGTPAPLSSATSPASSASATSPSSASSSGTSSSVSASATGAGATGNFGSRLSVSCAHLFLSGAFALWAFF